MNEFKAFGADKVCNAVLEKSTEAFLKPLKLIFDKSLSTGEVPKEWKEANVTPIFKKGSRLGRENYRPVSLTSTICKILEPIVRDHIMKYMGIEKLITPSQHGFVPNKACITNLLETLDSVTDAINKGFSVDLVLLDFAKAFDKVSHEKLILKLEAYGVNEVLVKWVRGFLSNRKQRVVIGDNYSEWVEVTSSVPQGSVLGPLLFTIFINDLPENVKNRCKLYADDCKLIGIVKNEDDLEQVQIDINKLQQWAKTWQMSFNYDKCKVMHFGKKNKESVYTMNMGQNAPLHIIEKTMVERDLGVMLSKDIKWANQTEKAVNAAKAIISQLRNSFTYFDPELVRLLYVSLIRPHLEYAVPVWNPYLRKDIDILENLQPKRDLRLTTLETRRKRDDLIQFYKELSGLDNIEWLNDGSTVERGVNARNGGICEVTRKTTGVERNREIR